MQLNNLSQPVLWQRLEGLSALIVAVMLYAAGDSGWLLFVLLLFVPDVSIMAYWLGNDTGQTIYNVVHAFVLPLLLAALAWWLAQPLLLSLALIWLAHIGLDRAVGYGLKEAAGFKYTHLGTMGGK